MRRMLLAAALAAAGGLGAASGPLQAADLDGTATGGLSRAGGYYYGGGPEDDCSRRPYGCGERWRYDDGRRYWDDDWRERRWRWREWERRRAWWWRHVGRHEFCWRHPDHWRCYSDYY
jgi:hypothetical protein